MKSGGVSHDPEKPGPASGETHEGLIDIQVKKVPVKRLVRFALGLETGDKPVKLRTLSIDSNADAEGLLDATLSVSVFTLVASNTK